MRVGEGVAVAADTHPSRVEVALSLVDPRSVDAVLAGGAPTVADCLDRLRLRDAAAFDGLGGHQVGRLQFGSEFCETLLPNPGQLRQVAAAAGLTGVALTLVTPIMSDAGIARLKALLPQLHPGSEVVANDWGTLRLLARERPDLVPIAGRMICKMVKDPRLPSAEWARLYPHGIHAGPFARVLTGLGVGRIEMDVPPFADIGDFRSTRFKVSAHAPFGFSVKGRACRIGSLNQPEEAKFATGHACRKECLTLVGELSRPELGANDLYTFQRGNTVFYRHSDGMGAAVGAAVRDGWIDRIVVAGDWHEAGRTL